MADEADIANAYISDAIAKAIEATLRQRLQKTSQTTVITKECEDCGEEIPLARRELGFQLCITCAQETERRKSLFVDY